MPDKVNNPQHYGHPRDKPSTDWDDFEDELDNHEEVDPDDMSIIMAVVLTLASIIMMAVALVVFCAYLIGAGVLLLCVVFGPPVYFASIGHPEGAIYYWIGLVCAVFYLVHNTED